MALQKDFKTRYGVDGNYINFQPQISNKTKITLLMSYFKDATSKQNGAISFNDLIDGSRTNRIIDFDCIYTFTYDLKSSDNIFIQGYKYLKTLPEFKDAVDC